MLSPEAHALIKTDVEAVPSPSKKNVKVIRLIGDRKLREFQTPLCDAMQEPALIDFVPSLIRRRFVTAAGITWLAEFRSVTVVFVKLWGIDYVDVDVGTLDRLHAVIQLIQVVVAQNRGYVARLLCDDKGTRLKLVFGMPTQSHSDDSVRAVRACIAMHEAVLQADLGKHFI